MSDEFDSINNRLPDLGAVLAQRIAAKQGSVAAPSTTPSSEAFDPYKAILKKKEAETAPIDPATIVKWPEKDVKALEDYCKKVGIIGFNCGRMHPIAALSMLKQQFGDFGDVPLEERVPAGYEKIGSSGYGPNFPYSKAVNKKQVIHG